MNDMPDKNFTTETATLAGGCFWCTEAVFERLKGVISVVSGYTGGRRENPSYEQIITGHTHHAEAIRITFDPTMISYTQLLDVFWATHDPTTLNQQGADRGERYRSAIFYENEEQHRTAEESKANLAKSGMYKDPIVTEIVPFTQFYPAENYHQNFYDTNRDYPYCTYVIDPKIQKLMKNFGEKVKEEYKVVSQ